MGQYYDEELLEAFRGLSDEQLLALEEINNKYIDDNKVKKEYEEFTISYKMYESEDEFQELSDLIAAELSEPYQIFTYRAFLNEHPSLTYLARDEATGKTVGGIISREETGFSGNPVGNIGMLVVHPDYRNLKIGTTLIKLVLRWMQDNGLYGAFLETECNNFSAIGLYENLGFVKTTLLRNYYLNASDAYRLEFFFKDDSDRSHEQSPAFSFIQQHSRPEMERLFNFMDFATSSVPNTRTGESELETQQ